MSKAADWANYARVPNDEDIAALVAMGIARVIIGSSFGTVWHDQMAACEPHFEVQNYCFPQHVTFTAPYWLDVEREENHVSTKDEVRAICASAMPPIGIYTSASMWYALMGDWDIVSEFPFLKLWVANYGPLPRPFTPFGGWTEPSMTQYAGTTDIGTGFEVDLSEYQEDAMTADEKAQFEKMQKDIEELKLYAWNDALRLNKAEVHKHAVTNGETGQPE